MANHLQTSGLMKTNQMIQQPHNNMYVQQHYHQVAQHQQQQQQYHLYSQQQQQLMNPHFIQQQQQQVEKQVFLANNTKLYHTLLGLAEKFRQSSNHRLVIHCLESILVIKPAIEPNQMLYVYFSLCKYYFKYTTNSTNVINSYLEKAVSDF